MADKDDLAVVAAQGLEGENPEDGSLPGIGQFTTWVKVGGVGLRTNDVDFKIGDRAVLRAPVTVVAVGDEMMHDGHVRHVVKYHAESVELQPAE